MGFGIIDLLSMQQGGAAGILSVPYSPFVYPLSLPDVGGIKRIRIGAQSSIGVSRSAFTFATQAQSFGNEFWKADVTLPDMVRADAEEWISFLLLLNGQVGTFMLGDPLGALPRGSVAGSPVVATGGQSGKLLVTSGWGAGEPSVLKAGDYIQIGERLYKVLRAVDADSSGNATLDIWPRLRESPDALTPIITNNCKGLFRLDSSNFEVWEADEGAVYSISFSCIEAV